MRKGMIITGLIIGIWYCGTTPAAQEVPVSRVIRWDHDQKAPGYRSARERAEKGHLPYHFNQAVYHYPDTLLPYYYELINTGNIRPDSKVETGNFIFKELPEFQYVNKTIFDTIALEMPVHYRISYLKKQPVLEYWFLPFRKNPVSGKIEKLVYFTYQVISSSASEGPKGSAAPAYSESSVLSGGKWIKMKIVQDGVYRINYADLVSMGLSNPSDPRIFGNGGEMLPFNSSVPHPDDLVENAIWLEKGSDGIFNQGDYLLFYGKGPGKWNFNSEEAIFLYQRHLYSDAAYYYITSDAGTGKKIQPAGSASGPENQVVTSFNDYAVHEEEVVNLIKSGREWYEPLVSYGSNRFDFSFPGLVTAAPVKIRSRLLARSANTSYFTLRANTVSLGTVTLPLVNVNSHTGDHASVMTSDHSFTSGTGNLSISLEFNNNGYTGAECWLDYLILNVRRQLKLEGAQMHFRDVESAGNGNISLFQLSNVLPPTRIWDVTDRSNVRQVQATYENGTMHFRLHTDSLRQFIAFRADSYLVPEIVENPVPNQDLHATGPADYIIVTHADFLEEANQLAEMHRTDNNLRTVVATPEEIYNEFSSGAPDVTAIRNFVKMFYDRAENEDELPKYLLLFGDGSYDNISASDNNTNYILTYQSQNSLRPTQSYVTDDFFGILDDGESVESGLIDIGIGRLPVTSVPEARTVIGKIRNYTDPGTMGDWRNMICFIGDDEDNNIHMRDANTLAEYIDAAYPFFNLDKIFLDAYPQVSSPQGESYPAVNKAINDRVNSGALIINYVGHGNERGLAHEAILGVSDILSWKNISKLPLFITATCEFSRFDDIDRTPTGDISKKTSAGEHVLLNPNGGGIGLLTTTRLVYSSPNFILNQNFYEYAFEEGPDQKPYRLGDALRLTKNISGTSINKRNFTLLGDPALRLAYPRYRIITDSVNGKMVGGETDTLKALSKVTISGYVSDPGGNILEGFSGTLYPIVFDKPRTVTTLGNDNNPPMSFSVQNNILYKGKASIENGRFTFSFIVPKDITYYIDYGKINYYGKSPAGDASGYCRDVLIGGFSDDPLIDDTGPEISLYLNDRYFKPGGITDENPRILAYVSDPNGINTVGNGIGHDIIAVLDDDYHNLLVLNDYYAADLNSYTSGRIEYQLNGLVPGPHTLRMKVWDVVNNSAEARIGFLVTGSGEFILKKLINYPNPFSESTAFTFEHNQTDGGLEVVITIADLAGQVIRIIDKEVYAGGYRIEPIEWDGRDASGNKIGAGIYVYRVQVRSKEGHQAAASGKLVVVR